MLETVWDLFGVGYLTPFSLVWGLLSGLNFKRIHKDCLIKCLIYQIILVHPNLKQLSDYNVTFKKGGGQRVHIILS